MTVPYTDIQELRQGSGLVELFDIDLTPFGGPLFRFTPNIRPTGASLSFGGETYLPMPIVSSGFDGALTGNQPTPTISVSNVTRALMSSVIAYGDLVGAKVTRRQTFEKYLDSGSTPDGTKFIGPEVYVIQQKVLHTNELITFQLATQSDIMGLYLPRRQFLRDRGFPGLAQFRRG